MPRPLAHGEWIETADGWRIVVLVPVGPSLYRHRDGQRYTVPELIDPATDGHVFAKSSSR
jgi:hypothetical protein